MIKNEKPIFIQNWPDETVAEYDRYGNNEEKIFKQKKKTRNDSTYYKN